ncbi:MAG: hypothetical protein HY235_05925 [Acidobacteria bacterium]|nr:hypothetical protein [Acidobacteriota bacterium]
MRPAWTRRQSLALLSGAALPLHGWQSFYNGKDEPLPRQIELAAGPLTMIFEPELAFLRYLRLGETEVIRGIYAAVRDRNWGAIAPKVTGLLVESREKAFRVLFDVECKEGVIDFLWHGEVTGGPDGAVRFQMNGEARAAFLRNRIGFCLLHPVRECAGKACTVRHSGGSIESGKFPLYVSPHQPFKDMAAILHQVAPGLTAEVTFSGEIFEMEDHRNWTDASYKTYCTPLDRPFPVEVKQGTKITQSVTIALRGQAPAAPTVFVVRRKQIAFEMQPGQVRPLPRIGLGVAADSPPLSTDEARRLALLRPAHLRADLKLAGGSGERALERAVKEAQAVGAPLELALHLSENAESELQKLAASLSSHRARVVRFLVFHETERSSDARWARLARQHLAAVAPGAQFGAGTNSYFAELNRSRPDPAGIDFVTYSINPQVHAFDNRSLVENLEAQADSVHSARQFAGGKGIVVSPVTFKPRFNPNATAGEAALPPDAVPPQVDPRQLSLFGAAWTAGSVKYLSESGAQSVTYFETTGAGGVIETAAGSRWPKQFPSQPSQVFPLYHVLADVGEFSGGEMLHASSSQPLVAGGFILRKGNRFRVLVANLTADAQAVRLTWPGAPRVRIKKLDEHSVRAATTAAESWRLQPGDLLAAPGGVLEVALAPYAVARLDSAEG